MVLRRDQTHMMPKGGNAQSEATRLREGKCEFRRKCSTIAAGGAGALTQAECSV